MACGELGRVKRSRRKRRKGENRFGGGKIRGDFGFPLLGGIKRCGYLVWNRQLLGVYSTYSELSRIM